MDEQWTRSVVEQAPGLHNSIPRTYSSVVRVGPLVFVAGQCGIDENARVVDREFAPQARQALWRVESALTSIGAEIRHITNMTTYLTDPDLADEFLSIRRTWYEPAFGGREYPPSTTLAVKALLVPHALIEVQVQAVVH